MAAEELPQARQAGSPGTPPYTGQARIKTLGVSSWALRGPEQEKPRIPLVFVPGQYGTKVYFGATAEFNGGPKEALWN